MAERAVVGQLRTHVKATACTALRILTNQKCGKLDVRSDCPGLECEVQEIAAGEIHFDQTVSPWLSKALSSLVDWSEGRDTGNALAACLVEAGTAWPGSAVVAKFCSNWFATLIVLSNAEDAASWDHLELLQASLACRGAMIVLGRIGSSLFESVEFAPVTPSNPRVCVGDAGGLCHSGRFSSAARRVLARSLLGVLVFLSPGLVSALASECLASSSRSVVFAVALTEVFVGVFDEAEPFPGIVGACSQIACRQLMLALVEHGVVAWLQEASGLQDTGTLAPLRATVLRIGGETAATALHRCVRNQLGVSEDLVDEIRHAFANADADGDGKLSVTELGPLLRTIGLKPSVRELRRVIGQVDVNNNGELEWLEFLMLMDRLGAGRSVEKSFTEEQLSMLRDAFSAFDTNDDGAITLTELKTVLEKLGFFYTDAEAQALIAAVDADDSGCIEWKEFLGLMLREMRIDSNDDPARRAFRVMEARDAVTHEPLGFVRVADMIASVRSIVEISDEEVALMISDAKFEDRDLERLTANEFIKMVTVHDAQRAY
mmetsp:Transcript_46981/g.124362  ORF Transcript_46981/g.124362 Transcript_46981/m.124362 type:complete len:547 (+) Transcript_46981:1610-3250(+)